METRRITAKSLGLKFNPDATVTTLPLITGFIGLMQGFGLQLILTNGGPGTSTMVPGHHMYLNAFTYDRLGYASALGLVLALIILTFTVFNLRYLRIRN